MSKKVKFFIIIAVALALALALRNEGFLYDPIKDGMPHNTSGQEWDQSPTSKKQTSSPERKW